MPSPPFNNPHQTPSRTSSAVSPPTSEGSTAAANGTRPGQRAPNQRRAFTRSLIPAYNSDGGFEVEHEHWCPILCEFFPRNQMKALHILPPPQRECKKKEKAWSNFSASSQRRMDCASRKSRWGTFRAGSMALVPNIPDVSSREEQDEWDTGIKSYKLEVVNVRARGARMRMPPRWDDSDGKRLLWPSQHGRVLRFRNQVRPGVGYLWRRWAWARLRRMRQELSDDDPRLGFRRVDRRHWGVIGLCLRLGPLSASVGETGTVFERLMGAIMDPEDEEREQEAGV